MRLLDFHSHTVRLFGSQTVILLECLNVRQSYYNNVILSDCQFFSLSDFQTVLLSDCQIPESWTIRLSDCQTDKGCVKKRGRRKPRTNANF